MKRKILTFGLVLVLVFIIITTFLKTFNFENKESDNSISSIYPNIDSDFVNELYDYLIFEDEQGRSTMYSDYYTNHSNLSYEIVLKTVYNYILKDHRFKLLNLSSDEFNNAHVFVGNESVDNYKPLYKINIKDFEEISHRVFGSQSLMHHRNFPIDFSTRAFYKENEGYLIYEKKEKTENKKYQVARMFDHYSVTNNSNVILIYDYYAYCNLETSKCYNDEKQKNVNPHITIHDGVVNLRENSQYAQMYEHTFKFENGYYYWSSSKPIKK